MFRSQFRQSEVEDLGVTKLGHENVGGLDVAVNDALGVRRIERLGDLDRQFEQLVRRQGLPSDALRSVIPSSNSMTMKDLTVLLADLVDGADVGVVERRSRPSLALETFQGLTASELQFGGKKLQSDVPAQRFVLGLVDDAHATAAELLDDAVVRDGLADHGLADHVGPMLFSPISGGESYVRETGKSTKGGAPQTKSSAGILPAVLRCSRPQRVEPVKVRTRSKAADKSVRPTH